MLWGIDELLTYHYLVPLGLCVLHTKWHLRSEYFMVAPAKLTHELFFSKSKSEQAELVWQGLFVERTPISEACQGVITTLQRQGIRSFVSSTLVTIAYVSSFSLEHLLIWVRFVGWLVGWAWRAYWPLETCRASAPGFSNSLWRSTWRRSSISPRSATP